MEQRQYPRFAQPLVIILLAIVTVTILVIGKSFFVPIVLATIFAMFLMPLAGLLEKWGAHRKIATLLALVVFLLVAIGMASGFSLLIRSFIISLPAVGDKITGNMLLMSSLIERFGLGDIIQVGNIKNWLINFAQSGSIGSVVSATTQTITQAMLTIVYTFFLLSYRDKLKLFLYKLTPDKNHDSYKNIINKMMRIVPQYLIGLFATALILAVLNSAAFMLLGLNQAIFLGTMVAILNIIPYIGPTVGFLFVIIFALLTHSPMHALGVGIVFFIVQFLDNNILTPSITASRIRLNGLTAIVGIVAGGMIWGVAGMVIALPVLGMIKIVLQYTPGFEPYAYLMGIEDTDEEEPKPKKLSLKIKSLLKKK